MLHDFFLAGMDYRKNYWIIPLGVEMCAFLDQTVVPYSSQFTTTYVVLDLTLLRMGIHVG
jgi:hypothetical protein